MMMKLPLLSRPRSRPAGSIPPGFPSRTHPQTLPSQFLVSPPFEGGSPTPKEGFRGRRAPLGAVGQEPPRGEWQWGDTSHVPTGTLPPRAGLTDPSCRGGGQPPHPILPSYRGGIRLLGWAGGHGWDLLHPPLADASLLWWCHAARWGGGPWGGLHASCSLPSSVSLFLPFPALFLLPALLSFLLTSLSPSFLPCFLSPFPSSFCLLPLTCPPLPPLFLLSLPSFSSYFPLSLLSSFFSFSPSFLFPPPTSPLPSLLSTFSCSSSFSCPRWHSLSRLSMLGAAGPRLLSPPTAG